MPHELNAQEVIRAGRAHQTHGAWERARAFAWALYGLPAARVTYSQTLLPADDHRLRTLQALAFDAAGRPMPYDFAAPWWAERDLPDYVLASAWELTQDDLARGLGGGFPDAIRDELRAFAEESLGVETLHTWVDRDESETLTWMFDFTAPPPLPHGKMADDTGATLGSEDIIQAGLERLALQRWQGTREYVHTLYGECAARVEVTMFSRYNDFTYDRDIQLDVRGAGGQRMFYDLRLPWWERFAFTKQEIAKYAEEHVPTAEADKEREYDAAYRYEVNTRAGGEIHVLATVLLGADFIATRHAWDTDTISYDLTQPPLLRHPRLWTHDDES